MKNLPGVTNSEEFEYDVSFFVTSIFLLTKKYFLVKNFFRFFWKVAPMLIFYADS